MVEREDTAVVMGASMAGLLAARALSEAYERWWSPSATSCP
jgi:flavin-dependent dehydrogenase